MKPQTVTLKSQKLTIYILRIYINKILLKKGVNYNKNKFTNKGKLEVLQHSLLSLENLVNFVGFFKIFRGCL